jgi:hypothetical protein
MLEDTRSVSENCLYVVFKPELTEARIRSYFAGLIKEVEEIICERSSTYVPNCKYVINIPPISNTGKSYAYIWVTSKEVAHIIVGRNYDGSFISDASKDVDVDDGPKSAKDTLFKMDWDFTPILSTAKCEKYAPKPVEGCTIPPFVIRAKAEDPGAEYTFGTLFCKSPLPKTYKESYLHELFSPFNTSDTESIQVTKTLAGNAYIRFPKKIDACFALMLTKKHVDQERNLVLSFDHALFREKQTKPSYPRNNNYNNNSRR